MCPERAMETCNGKSGVGLARGASPAVRVLWGGGPEQGVFDQRLKMPTTGERLIIKYISGFSLKV